MHKCQQRNAFELLRNVNHGVIHTCDSLDLLADRHLLRCGRIIFFVSEVVLMHVFRSIFFCFVCMPPASKNNSFCRADGMGKVSHHLLQQPPLVRSSTASVAAQSYTIGANMRRATQRMVSVWAEVFLNPPASCIAPLVLHDDLAELLWVLD